MHIGPVLAYQYTGCYNQIPCSVIKCMDFCINYDVLEKSFWVRVAADTPREEGG